MLIYQALKKDHDKLKPLLATLVKSSTADEETRAKLIAKIRDELIPHSRAEEAIFYNSLRTIEGTKALVAHSYTEHLEAEALLRSLQTMDAMNIEWKKTAQKLKTALEHHIAEEEGRIFPAAKLVLMDEEARLMAQAFEQMKPEILEGSFLQSTLDFIVNVMPTRFANQLRDFIHRA
jgi:hemerythrin superfamily protein